MSLLVAKQYKGSYAAEKPTTTRFTRIISKSSNLEPGKKEKKRSQHNSLFVCPAMLTFSPAKL